MFGDLAVDAEHYRVFVNRQMRVADLILHRLHPELRHVLDFGHVFLQFAPLYVCGTQADGLSLIGARCGASSAQGREDPPEADQGPGAFE